MSESTVLSWSPRVLFVSTYPPTQCGIATFTSCLVDSMASITGDREGTGVIRLRPLDDGSPSVALEIVSELVHGRDRWVQGAIDACEGFDVLWLQHEYGIFGPDDGIGALDLVARSPIPVAATIHSVPARPSRRQRRILEALGDLCSLLVVMTKAGRQRLVESYRIDRSKVWIVPHGAQRLARPTRTLSDPRPVIVNWGLIGPGKGLEWAIRAMALLGHMDPCPRLLIKGTTHPKIEKREGESYRNRLLELVAELDLTDRVEIEDGYMSADQLDALKQAADLVLLPYDSRDQVTSGVLVEAVAAGLPVVATAFPHAVELLSDGAGIVVPHTDSSSIAAAIETLLGAPEALRAASEAASAAGVDLAWPHVASQYIRLSRRVVEAQAISVA